MKNRPNTITSGPLLAGSIIDEQKRLEADARHEGVKRYRRLAKEAIERGEAASLKPVERFLLHWFEHLTAAIKAHKQSCARGEPGTGRAVYASVLRHLDSKRLAVITMHETLNRCVREPYPMATGLKYGIGRAVIAEIHMDMLRNFAREEREQRQEAIAANPDLANERWLDSVKMLDRRFRNLNPGRVNWWAKRTLADPIWERSVCTHTGNVLLWLLIGVANATDYGEEFHQAIRYYAKGVKGASVSLDRRVVKMIEQGHAVRQFMRPRYLPMVSTPANWTDTQRGGYYMIETPFISKPTKDQKAALESADLSAVFDCLNAVNAAQWRINDALLAVIDTEWEAGGGSLAIPRAHDHPLPPKPANLEDDDEARKKWKRDAAEVHSRNAELSGARVEFQFKMTIAEEMQGREALYFPHQFDFRGRCYPIPPHLNHQGDDVCRGLLEFAEEIDPGTAGERWIRIHAANCYGFDKETFDDRSRWAEDNMARAQNCARDPLIDSWWRAADKPWQFLAACRAMMDDGAASRLPVQIDGTCNGLQHYAAMGRDAEGASVVNLLPASRPADVYTDVAQAVARRVEQDAAAGSETAKRIEGHISRAIVKQPVMTSVYGVTMVGARQQVEAKLEDIGITGDDRYTTAKYLSRIVMDGIGEVCQSATAIMDWLTTCARAVVDTGNLIQWETPLGFPVVQPYRKAKVIKLQAVKARINLRVDSSEMPIARRKQINGFAPNYVHSIDATHMLMTARQCRKEGITFAAVHDSYWTHAAHVDRLGAILREQFVILHSRPLLDELKQQLESRYAIDLPDPPAPGTLDIEAVKASPYFFS